MYDLSPGVVHDLHLEGSAGAAAHSGEAAAVLLGEEDVLAERVGDLIFVFRLPPSEGLQQLHLLLDEEVVDHGEVLQSRRSHVSQT